MGKQLITDTKILKQLISQAKAELKLQSSKTSQLIQIEPLSLQIHENYLTSIAEQEKINDSILSLQEKLEENVRNSLYYKDALIRLLIPQEFSLTLVYKSQSNIPYIKGRVYWDNKQREVQIGSINNVIAQIKCLCNVMLLPSVKGIKKKNITWEDIKANPEIESAVQYLGKIKFKQYLLKHFKFPKEKSHSGQLLQADYISSKEENKLDTDGNTQNLIESNDWYSLWRKNNL